MSVTRIASRYAKSLMDLSIERNELEPVLEDMKSFKKATENRDLYMMLKSPIINATKKLQIFEALFGEQFHKMTSGFMRLIVSKGRESFLPEIATEFIKQYKSYKHISSVKLTTASVLGDDALAAIKKQLLNSSSTDQNVEIELAVDPKLIGGFIIEFDDKLYDSSVAHKLEMLKKEFKDKAFTK